jgi:hypothetical protein
VFDMEHGTYHAFSDGTRLNRHSGAGALDGSIASAAQLLVGQTGKLAWCERKQRSKERRSALL